MSIRFGENVIATNSAAEINTLSESIVQLDTTKANKANTYTKTEVDDLIEDTLGDIENALASV